MTDYIAVATSDRDISYQDVAGGSERCLVERDAGPDERLDHNRLGRCLDRSVSG